MSKKKLLNFGLVALLYGIFHGIILIEDFQLGIVRYIAFLYPVVLVSTLICIKLKFDSKGINNYVFPIFTIIMYIPANILSGIYFGNGISYYGSFPRYGFIVYYALILVVIYVFAYLIDKLLQKKFSSIVFVLFDMISLGLLPYAFVYTYFVSPH